MLFVIVATQDHDEYQRYSELGLLAALSHRAGFASFNPHLTDQKGRRKKGDGEQHEDSWWTIQCLLHCHMVFVIFVLGYVDNMCAKKAVSL